MRKKDNDLFPQCKDCKDLGDCPHPEVEDNELGTPMPPAGCPSPITIMAQTLKNRKLKNSKYE
jgi:hypothetical protein